MANLVGRWVAKWKMSGSVVGRLVAKLGRWVAKLVGRWLAKMVREMSD